jgi:hypothetical protein
MGVAEVMRDAEPEETQLAGPDEREHKRLVTTKSFAATLRQRLSDETARPRIGS